MTPTHKVSCSIITLLANVNQGLGRERVLSAPKEGEMLG